MPSARWLNRHRACVSDMLSSQFQEKSHLLESQVSLLLGDVAQLDVMFNLSMSSHHHKPVKYHHPREGGRGGGRKRGGSFTGKRETQICKQ